LTRADGLGDLCRRARRSLVHHVVDLVEAVSVAATFGSSIAAR
jgi:hypothetical protein